MITESVQSVRPDRSARHSWRSLTRQCEAACPRLREHATSGEGSGQESPNRPPLTQHDRHAEPVRPLVPTPASQSRITDCARVRLSSARATRRSLTGESQCKSASTPNPVGFCPRFGKPEGINSWSSPVRLSLLPSVGRPLSLPPPHASDLAFLNPFESPSNSPHLVPGYLPLSFSNFGNLQTSFSIKSTWLNSEAFPSEWNARNKNLHYLTLTRSNVHNSTNPHHREFVFRP